MINLISVLDVESIYSWTFVVDQTGDGFIDWYGDQDGDGNGYNDKEITYNMHSHSGTGY